MANLSKLGNEELLKRCKTAFLCSRQTSYSDMETIKNWAYRLSPEKDCILCGNHSPAEQVVFKILLEQKIPTILVLAETMKEYWEYEIRVALKEERILILTHCDNSVHQINKQSAIDRNLTILTLADNIVIGHCTKGGNIDKQTTGLTNVTYLTKTTERTYKSHEDIANFRLPGINGYLFFDLQNYHGRQFLKITQSKPNEQGYYEKNNIYIEHSELEQFRNIIKQIADKYTPETENKKNNETH